MTGQTRSLDQQTTILGNIQDAPVFRNSGEFSLHIETLAFEKRITHMEAIIDFCERHQLEPIDVAGKLNKGLKDKIAEDARNLNYLPKKTQLEEI